MSHRKGPPDPAPEYKEWTGHQYDPGYWSTGRVVPHLRRLRRGNRFGYLLLVSGLATAVGSTATFKGADLAWVDTIVLALLALLQFVAGIRLIRKSS